MTAVPLVQMVADTEPTGLAKTILSDALDSLLATRSRTSVSGIASNIALTLDALCSGAHGARLGACQAMRNELGNAMKQIAEQRSIPARNALNALSARAADAVRQGASTATSNAPSSSKSPMRGRTENAPGPASVRESGAASESVHSRNIGSVACGTSRA